ncbi:MAG TPA: non-homologous end-joining DNA ligase [Candidatus Nanopelagicales bacterium]|jgi:bifunctional non-homologous end joining protein LigD|nr:non-homologous end-joining DNA ligase [Candidatus Nanopelagicales bacterium]
MSPDRPVTVEVEGRTLRLTHLDKVLYPATGTTKAEVIDYYRSIAAVLLPQLADRPITRKRWPDGVEGQVFFEKNVPRGHPPWLRTVTFHHADRGRGRAARDVAYVLADDAATLVWLAQVAALELHCPQWRVGPEGQRLPPDRLVVDLDPGPPAGLDECATVALAARDLLVDAGSDPVAVLSGSKGLHLYAALEPAAADHAADVAQVLAGALAEQLPALVVPTMARAERAGRVYVDWSQNNPAKTTITPYSLRGRERPTAAMPVGWDEVEAGGLRQVELAEVPDRLQRFGDLMRGR